MRIPVPAFILLALLVVTSANLMGCASVPKESIELSATVGRDLDAVHTSHRTLAELYFDDLLRRIDEFVDREYRPYILHEMMTELDVASEIEAAIAGQSDLDVLDITSIVVEESIARIEIFRREMRAPIAQQRRETVAAIDQAYQQLQAANAVVTGHLASVAKVHDLQDEALADAGLAGFRQDMTRRLARLSDGVGRVLDEARDADTALDELPGRLSDAIGRSP